MALFESRTQTLQRMAEERNRDARDVGCPVPGKSFIQEYKVIPARDWSPAVCR